MMKNQRGAIFTLFALLIPLIMAFTGLVVDFGNLYAHYSRLQNAADAAALAGGYAFIQYDETCEDHPMADEAANKYKEKNHPHADELGGRPPQAKPGDDEGIIYYRVILTERVPLYFLRYFPTIGEDTEISAVGCAKVKPNNSAGGAGSGGGGSGGGGSGGGGNNMFDHLFTAGKGLESINSIQNPDNHNIKQDKNNCSTYDGSIVIGDKNGYDKANKNVYLSSKAFGENGNSRPTVNQAIDDGNVVSPQYDSSINQAAIEKYYHDEIENIMKAAEVASRDEIQKMMDGNTEAKNKIKITDNNMQNLNSDTLNKLSDKGVDVIYYNISNLNIDLNRAISGDASKPLYIICDNINNFNTSANMTDGRPIVLVYTGTNRVTMNCNGGTFTGDIYSPFGSVFVNDNRHMFYGSIVAAKDINLQSQGYYAQKNYTRSYSGSPGSGSPGDAPGNPTVILVDDKEIEWT
ncbi:TadE family protein [uncultured Anaerovibrio sp.]|uniref:TadE family protein n=1 Tax=uncultured Anaerovibrio sp. TaxID=361586 RepID=UPI0026019568|nr:TadE family protein [uncultured Anaerovibrio sp.]